MKYRITGADAKTGQDCTICVEAGSEHDAVAQAKARDVFTYRCIALPDESSAPQAVDPSGSPANQSDGDQNVLAGCLTSLIGFSLGVGIVGVVLMHQTGILWLLGVVLSFLGALSLVASISIGLQSTPAAAAARKQKAEQNAKIICPHCQEKGFVHTEKKTINKGIHGGKAAAAIISGGASVLVTGLSRRGNVTEAKCSNCGSVWHF